MRLHVKRGSVHRACGQPATKMDEKSEKAKGWAKSVTLVFFKVT